MALKLDAEEEDYSSKKLAKLKIPKEKVLGKVDFFSLLFHAITQTHIFHLQTNSYAAHMALGSFYGDLEDLLDTLIESYQGSHGIQKGYSAMDYSDIPADCCAYFRTLLASVEKCQKMFTESDEVNVIDEMKTLIRQTLYKLENLK